MGSIARTAAQGVTARVVAAAKGHLESILRIEREAFSDPWSAEAFLGMIDSPLALFFVAVDAETEVVGYVAAAGIREDGEIFNIAVCSAQRGRGIGGTLLDFALDALRKQLVGRVILEVRESNAAAIGLYKSRGFEELSQRRNYYRRPVENALVLRLELNTATERDASC